MKKKLISLTLICVLLISISGCFRETPEYLPGENKGDDQFVWICEKPFAFFYTTNNTEDYYETLNEYNEEMKRQGYPTLPTEGFFQGLMKGYIKKDGEFVCFYSEFTWCEQRTSFREKESWGDPLEYDSFFGSAEYYEDYFEFEVEKDSMNFFDGELPYLKFNKMTKEAFLEKYGDIEGVRDRLE